MENKNSAFTEVTSYNDDTNYYPNTHGIDVVGVMHRQSGVNPQKIIRKLKKADKIILEYDPTNKYDSTAIKVKTASGIHIGWIAKNDSVKPLLLDAFKNKKDIIACISEIYKLQSYPGNLGFKIDIDITEHSTENIEKNDKQENGGQIMEENFQAILKKTNFFDIIGILLIILGAPFSIFIIGFIPVGFGIYFLCKASKNRKATYESAILEQKDIVSKKQEEIKRLDGMLTPEIKDVAKLRELKEALEIDTNKLHDKAKELNDEIAERGKNLIILNEEILMQEFGIYKPTYDFANSEEYRARLEKIRSEQKEMIRNKTAATGNENWSVNGSSSQGKKMVNDTIKLLLRAFNGECDSIIDKVKYNNFETSLKRITTSKDAISKFGNIMGISITQKYYDSKIDELTLAFEYRQKKQEEKELQKELKAQMREDAKLQKEIEAERKKIEKEQQHYQNAMLSLNAQIDAAQGEEKEALLAKKAEIENQLSDIEKAMADIDYREANQRAGYVYIISNIGSFGENIFKIGMTRRLDPTERVLELGDASVPFNFDIHAMIFSDDAPALEAALHKAFESKKLNMVNTRREFFNVSLDEIKDVVKKNFDKTVEFVEIPDAEQYRVSQKMRMS